MSKGMGKVLDAKISRKVAIPVGNAVIKGFLFPFKWAGKQIEKEMRMKEKKKKKWEQEGRVLNRSYSLPSNIRIRK